MRRVGILTGGGDCAGLNPAIRAIVRTASRGGWEAIGFLRGWKGMLENESRPLNVERIDDLLRRGGTSLGTSRTNPYKEKEGEKKILEMMKAQRLDALIAIGGEDTLGVAAKLFEAGVKVVGVPKTIDNDLNGTEFTLGFETAVEAVAEAIDRLQTTAESHNRVFIVEIMGRHAGWLATYGGIAGGADAILVPEFPMRVSEVMEIIRSCRARGKNYAIIAVAEGAKILRSDGREVVRHSAEAVDAFDHVQLGGIGEALRVLLAEEGGFDTRVTVLGHVQRGGAPTAFDRILGTAYGAKAMELVLKGEFGMMPALSAGRIVVIPLKEAVRTLKTLRPEVYELAKGFFG